MPVPNVPVGFSKLQSNQKRRGLFATFLLMGVLPTGLVGQELDPNPWSQNRLDSAVGDIPASPWSRRNSPTRQASMEEGTTVSQPRAVPQTRKSEDGSQEIRLGEAFTQSSQSTSGPATIRWGAIQAPKGNATSPVKPRLQIPTDSAARENGSLFQERPQEYRDPDTFVMMDDDTIPSKSSSSRSSSITTSNRRSPTAVEPLIKPAATRTRSASVDTELELGVPAETIPPAASNRNVVQTNTPIRLVPDDTVLLESSLLESSRDDGPRSLPTTSMNTENQVQNGESRAATSFSEAGAQRMLVAQRLSHELLSQSQVPPSRTPQALENPAGWQSIEQELRTNLERCDQLLRRGAVHSARSEAIAGLRRLFRTMDAYRGSFSSEPALDSALTAFREEADFHTLHGVTSVAHVVATHTTPALKNRPLESVSPEIASQHYRVFARFQFITAADGHRWASDMLYALGKTYEKEGELSIESSIRLRSQAVVCYQSAIQITPQQSEASNQLGYALIHLDRIEEAYAALKASIESQPNAQAWSNLAEVYRRRGAIESANYAVQQASALAQRSAPVFTPENPEITQVDPAVFAKYSPAQNVIAPTSSTNSGNVTASASTVAKQPNFFSKMFAR